MLCRVVLKKECQEKKMYTFFRKVCTSNRNRFRHLVSWLATVTRVNHSKTCTFGHNQINQDHQEHKSVVWNKTTTINTPKGELQSSCPYHNLDLGQIGQVTVQFFPKKNSRHVYFCAVKSKACSSRKEFH